MARKTIPEQAAEIRAAIAANVEDMYAKRITHEEFHARQIALWDRAQVSRRLDDAVLALMRGDLAHPSLRSAS
jgi:hypothetical protein